MEVSWSFKTETRLSSSVEVMAMLPVLIDLKVQGAEGSNN